MMKIIPLGHTLSLFLVITFILCIVWGVLMPMNMHMHQAREPMMPGFHFISFPSFLIGVIEAYIYGWYAAVVFVPLYNFFNTGRPA